MKTAVSRTTPRAETGQMGVAERHFGKRPEKHGDHLAGPTKALALNAYLVHAEGTDPRTGRGFAAVYAVACKPGEDPLGVLELLVDFGSVAELAIEVVPAEGFAVQLAGDVLGPVEA